MGSDYASDENVTSTHDYELHQRIETSGHDHHHGRSHHEEADNDTFVQKPVGENYLFSNSRVGELLEVHISRIEDIGPNADRLLEERLEEIKKDVGKAGGVTNCLRKLELQ